MLNLNDMLLFAKVAELKGISAAARALNMPKSKVSRHMVELETALGTGLLERTTRSVELTEAGEIFFQHCKRVVEEKDGAIASVNQLLETPRGHLRVSVSTSIGQYLIAPHLGEFARKYPDIELQLDLNNRRVDLISEGYDLVIRVGQLQDSSLMSKRIGTARAHLYAAPEYIAKYGTPKKPDQLREYTLLAMSNSNNIAQWTLENTAGDIKAVEAQPKHTINDFSALRDMAEGGAGIAIAPEYVIRSGIEKGRLVRVLPDWRSTMVGYYVLYPSRKGLTKKSQAWIDFFTGKLTPAE